MSVAPSSLSCFPIHEALLLSYPQISCCLLQRPVHLSAAAALLSGRPSPTDHSLRRVDCKPKGLHRPSSFIYLIRGVFRAFFYISAHPLVVGSALGLPVSFFAALLLLPQLLCLVCLVSGTLYRRAVQFPLSICRNHRVVWILFYNIDMFRIRCAMCECANRLRIEAKIG